MTILDKEESLQRLREIFDLLKTCEPEWVCDYFEDERGFAGLADDEDVRFFAYRDDEDRLVAAAVTDENAILTAGFLGEAVCEACFAQVLRDVTAHVRAGHYTSIFYGEGRNSFGVYYRPDNPFGDYLKAHGFALESVGYDIRYAGSGEVQRHVDQLKAQKIRVPFEVCGRYESLAEDF